MFYRRHSLVLSLSFSRSGTVECSEIGLSLRTPCTLPCMYPEGKVQGGRSPISLHSTVQRAKDRTRDPVVIKPTEMDRCD